jgi:hypothetical protein
MNHVLIYIPSYFDYVRLRNYFRREGLNFVQICEYSKVRSIRTIMHKYWNIKTAVFRISRSVVWVHFFPPWRWKQQAPAKRPLLSTILHGFMCHRNLIIWYLSLWEPTDCISLSQCLSHWILFHYTEGTERSPVESDCDIQGFFLAAYCRIPFCVLLHMTLYLVNLVRTKLYLFDLKTQFVPRSKHSAPVIETDKLVL